MHFDRVRLGLDSCHIFPRITRIKNTKNLKLKLACRIYANFGVQDGFAAAPYGSAKKGGFTAIRSDLLFPWLVVEGGKHSVFQCVEINAVNLKVRFHYC